MKKKLRKRKREDGWKGYFSLYSFVQFETLKHVKGLAAR